jgi:methionyl aminopeptidase
LEGKIEDTPILVPGMTIAVEVIYLMGSSEVMYSGQDDWTIKSADGSLGGLFERTVLVTESGHKILTQK